MDAPRPAVRNSAVLVEIRALGSHFVAIFVSKNTNIRLLKQIFPNPQQIRAGVKGGQSTRGSQRFGLFQAAVKGLHELEIYTTCFRSLGLAWKSKGDLQTELNHKTKSPWSFEWRPGFPIPAINNDKFAGPREGNARIQTQVNTHCERQQQVYEIVRENFGIAKYLQKSTHG